MRAFLILVVLAACGSGTPPPAAPPAPPPTPAPASSDIIQPPFGADDLRAAFEVGLTIRYRIVDAGKARVEEWTVTAADADGCTIQLRTFADDGTTLVDTGAHVSKWTELETHGRFPAALTTRTDSSIDVPAGHFDTWLFEVRPAKPTDPIKRLHFARTLPGPPVWVEVEHGDVVVLSMQLLSRTSP